MWIWISIIVSPIALGVALMTLPQMVWGKPHIKVMFESRDSKNGRRGPGRYLECKFFNPPVNNRLLRILGVYHRHIDGLHVSFSIKNTKTNVMIVADVRADIDAEWNIEPRPSVSLPASRIPAMISLVMTRSDSGISTAIDDYDAQNIKLPVGEYCALISIESSEEKTELHKKFFVGTKSEDLCWESM